MKWLKNLICDSEDVSSTKYFGIHGPFIADCIRIRNVYGPSGLRKPTNPGEGCQNEPIRKLLKYSPQAFELVDRNAEFYAEHKGFVEKLKKAQEKDSFIDIPKKSNEIVYVIFFILAVVLFFKLKK